jgi:hypothetical protein
VLDTHANESFSNGHCVLGHELLEGDEEACLDGNATRDGRVPAGGLDCVGLGLQRDGDVQCSA